MDRGFLRAQRSLLDDRNGQARDGDALAGGFFGDIGLPDLRSLADMKSAAFADDISFSDSADMIAIDFEADGAEFIRIDRHPGGDAAERFG